jgi:PAS domain S-box-containing protein
MKNKASFRESPQDYDANNDIFASFGNMDPAIVGLTSAGKIVYANQSACDLLGYPKEVLECQPIGSIAPEMTTEAWLSFWLELDQTGLKPGRTTIRLSSKKELSVEFAALLIHESGQKCCGILLAKPENYSTTAIDVSIHGQPFNRVLNSMANPVIVIDDRHKVTFLNQAACQALGTTAAEAAGGTVYDYLPKRHADIIWALEQKALDSGRPATHFGDGFLQAKYGVSWTALPFLDPGTSQKRLLVILNKSPQTAYTPRLAIPGEPVPVRPKPRSAPELYEILERGGPLGIFLKNTDNRYLWVNHTFARIAGFQPDDFIGKCVEDVVPDPVALATSYKEDDYVYSTGKPLLNRTSPRFNNQPGYYRLDKFPFVNRNGELTGIIGLAVEADEPQPPIAALKEDLSSTSKKLQDTETALRVLIERREQDVSLTREELNTKVKDQLVPYLEHLKQTQLNPEQAEFVGLIETNLKNFYDPAYARLSSPTYKLSPTELKVAQLIRDGKTNKEIAHLLHLSKSTILTHRHHIRVKLGIKNKKVNLRSLLNS